MFYTNTWRYESIERSKSRWVRCTNKEF